MDEDRILENAIAQWRETEQKIIRRATQSISFDSGPICFAFAADLHLGDHGTNYPRVFDEADIIAKTPGMFVVTVGDMVNNFVIGKLRQARDESRIAISDEWVLTRRYLNSIAPKWLAAVAGNHDNWTNLLAGIDYFRDVAASIKPNLIYDSDDARIMVKVADVEYPIRIRHQWRGSSIYNPTHGIERAFTADHDFTLGVGAHTHVSGVARSFNASGENGLAVLCGSYKRFDMYAHRLGFPKPNRSTAVAVIFEPYAKTMIGCDNLEAAARIMRGYYS